MSSSVRAMPVSSASGGGARLGYVDSIRGIAALAVIYLHMARYFVGSGLSTSGPEYIALYIGAYIFDAGKIAVALFFAVSGFVVPFSLLRGKQNPIRDFFLSRFFRLYPAYWISIPFGVYLFFILPDKQFGIPAILANLTMLQQILGKPDAIGVYWTLQLEIMFYVLCVVIFLLGKLRDPKFLFVVAIAMLSIALLTAVGRFVSGRNLPVAIPLSLTVMLFGLLWRFALIEGDLVARRCAKWLGLLFVVSMPLIAILAYNRDTGLQESWYRYTLSYYTALGIFIAFTTKWKIHSSSVQYLGKISYSVYLFGPVVQELLFIAIPPKVHHDIPVHVYVAVTMVMAVFVGSIIYYLVEKSSIGLGKRVAAYFDGGVRQRSPTTEVI